MTRHLIENCKECGTSDAHASCQLSAAGLQEFEAVKITNTYSPGCMLFVEGQPANGVYLLCYGEVKLYTCSRDGKVVILHIARPGEMIGLSSVVSGVAYEVSAEVIEPCQTNFIAKADFLRLLNTSPELAMKTVRQLCSRYIDTCSQIRSFVLSNSAADKLAKLMIDWCTQSPVNGRIVGEPIRIKLRFTHEEIAEMIGTSRETVTRLLKDFRERDLIRIKGADLYIPSVKDLDAMIGKPRGSRA